MSRASTGGTPADILKFTDDDRAELVQAAAQAERSARPVHLLVLASMLLVAGLGALMVTWSRVEKAERSLKFQQNMAEEMRLQVALLNRLKEDTAARGPAAGDELAQIRSVIAQAATTAGIKNANNLLPESDRADPPRPGANSVQRKFRYRVQDVNLPALFEWMKISTQQVAGLEVYAVKLTPRPNDWELSVTFSRWERKK